MELGVPFLTDWKLPGFKIPEIGLIVQSRRSYNYSPDFRGIGASIESFTLSSDYENMYETSIYIFFKLSIS